MYHGGLAPCAESFVRAELLRRGYSATGRTTRTGPDIVAVSPAARGPPPAAPGPTAARGIPAGAAGTARIRRVPWAGAATAGSTRHNQLGWALPMEGITPGKPFHLVPSHGTLIAKITNALRIARDSHLAPNRSHGVGRIHIRGSCAKLQSPDGTTPASHNQSFCPDEEGSQSCASTFCQRSWCFPSP
jgi:hypothetical protein